MENTRQNALMWIYAHWKIIPEFLPFVSVKLWKFLLSLSESKNFHNFTETKMASTDFFLNIYFINTAIHRHAMLGT